MFLAMLLSCCQAPYFIKQRMQHEIYSVYPVDQEIYFSDYFLCSFYREGSILGRDIQFGQLNEDSVFHTIQKALNSLPLSIRYANDIRHHCDSAMGENLHLKMQEIDEEALIQLAEVSGEEVVLIPIFYLGTSDMMFIGPSRSANGNSRSHFIWSVVYLIKDSEIIYSRKVLLSPRGQDIDQWDPDPPTPITQEHWNKLVYLLMKKYLGRRK